MAWLKWIIVLLAVTEAGWMTFDGLRALVVGDYVTPKTGEWAGQLGPWSRLVSAVGIEPRSTLMKCIFRRLWNRLARSDRGVRAGATLGLVGHVRTLRRITLVSDDRDRDKRPPHHPAPPARRPEGFRGLSKPFRIRGVNRYNPRILSTVRRG